MLIITELRLAFPSPLQPPHSSFPDLTPPLYNPPPAASLPIQEGLIFSFLSDASVEPTPFTEADCKVGYALNAQKLRFERIERVTLTRPNAHAHVPFPNTQHAERG